MAWIKDDVLLHLVSLPQQRQLIAVDGTFHHMNVIVFNTKI